MTIKGQSEEARMARLPKWAQQRIEMLESNVAYWKERATAGPEDSMVFADRGHNDMGKPLGAHARVRFYEAKPTDNSIGSYFDVYLDERFGGLQVRGPYSIAVLPNASNSIRVIGHES